MGKLKLRALYQIRTAGSLPMIVAFAFMIDTVQCEEETAIPVVGTSDRLALLPDPVTGEHFAALLDSSPFFRAINLSESFALTGVAEIDGKLVATILERETKKTHMVSSTTDSRGWKLVELEGDQSNLETVAALISVPGSEVVSIRFEKSQLSPDPGGSSGLPPVPREHAERIAAEARNFRRGISADGYRGAPPPELIEKLSKLTEETRGRMIYHVGEMRSRGVSSEKRQKVFVQMVDRALQNKR